MRLSDALDRPLVRLSFLAFAVLATVATSQAPGWSKTAKPIDEEITLEPNASVERRFTYEGSRDVELTTQISGTAEVGARVTVIHDDTRDGLVAEPPRSAFRTNACDATFLFEKASGREWADVDTSGKPVKTTRPEPAGTTACSTTSGTVVVKITNQSAKAITLKILTIASIYGEADDEDEDDAFVRASIDP